MAKKVNDHIKQDTLDQGQNVDLDILNWNHWEGTARARFRKGSRARISRGVSMCISTDLFLFLSETDELLVTSKAN